MKNLNLFFAVMAAAVSIGSVEAAGIKIDPGNMSPYSKTHVGAALYTKPDPSAEGAIRGKLIDAPSKILGVAVVYQQFPNVSALGDVADGASGKNAKNVNQNMKNPVYLANLSDDGSFSATGLPPGKYDLFVMCENCFYEGLVLSREENTLTPQDIGVIKAKIKESNGFFNVKSQERIEGQTGNYGKARVLEQEVRTLPVNLQSAEVRTDIQIRSMKLCFMESVGNARAGVHWEMKKTRELTRQELGPPETKGLIPGYHRKSLGGIRVSTRLKDLGTISLSKDASE